MFAGLEKFLGLKKKKKKATVQSSKRTPSPVKLKELAESQVKNLITKMG